MAQARTQAAGRRASAAVAILAVLALAAGLVAMPRVQAQGGAPVVEPARQLSADEDPSRLYGVPAIAVDPEDPGTVAVALADDRNGRCGVRFSLDRGLSWTSFAEVMPEDRPFCIQRNLGRAIDLDIASNGTLHWGSSGSSPDTTPPHPNGPVDAIAARVPSPDGSPEAFTIVEGTVRDDYEHRDGDTYEVIEHHKYNSVAVDPSDPDRAYRGWRFTVRGIE